MTALSIKVEDETLKLLREKSGGKPEEFAARILEAWRHMKGLEEYAREQQSLDREGELLDEIFYRA